MCSYTGLWYVGEGHKRITLPQHRSLKTLRVPDITCIHQ